MSCNNPLEKCCEIVSSSCVQFTGTLRSDSFLTAVCETSVTSLLEQIDEQIVILSSGVQIPLQALKDADTCSKIDVTDITIRPSDYRRPDYVKVNDVTKQLVSIVCDLQSQIKTIHDTEKLNIDFFNLPLPDSMVDKLSCLNCDSGCDAKSPTTLRTLIEILVGKIIDYENKNSKLNCENCGCIDC
jgi:hypothetical protein